MTIEEKFAKLGVDNAPGQEVRRKDSSAKLTGDELPGTPVDFSHGDVNAHPPIPAPLKPSTRGMRWALPRHIRNTVVSSPCGKGWQKSWRTSPERLWMPIRS